MECFNKARSVRLRSHLGKYLIAADDQGSVRQTRNGSSPNATWTVERVEGHNHCIRLKSRHGTYLTASAEPFLLGMTGKKVVQSVPAAKKESSVEWEPRKEGYHVRLRTRGGNFLRANGAMPPWRNSVTHDVPQRTATQDWVLWVVDVVEIEESPPGFLLSPAILSEDFSGSNKESHPVTTSLSQNYEPSVPSPAKGRTIYYNVSDDEGNVGDGDSRPSFVFMGKVLVELKQKLKEETELDDDFIICSRNPLNGKLYPLRLHLPPNNADMHVVLVPSSSKVARDLQEAR